jgi:hypothetical protein
MQNIQIKPEKEFVDEQGPVLEDGEIYDAMLTGFAEFNGQFGPGLVWRFKVYDEEHGEVEAAGFSSQSMSAGDKPSKLITWARKLMGGELPEGGIAISELEGKPARVEIENYTKNGIIKNKVVDVKAPSKGKARGMTAA